MQNQTSIVVTSIAKPNKVLKKLAEGSHESGFSFIVIGDVSSPGKFFIESCQFFSLRAQEESNFVFPKICPKRHYSRKNIGYLFAMQSGAEIIIDTDDDNFPYNNFWSNRDRIVKASTLVNQGWVNVYKYFTDEQIWPRGIPLNKITIAHQSFESFPVKRVDCPIQQGLVNNNPDVDAIYRLIFSQRAIYFREDRRLALAKGSWCPFNSQNTLWYHDAFPLLYLPSSCSFRMTDIIRSFVAQRIAWANGWAILFHEPTMLQERNEHNLMKDFEDEIPGYLNNEMICEELEKLPIKKGLDMLHLNLEICYEKLVEIGAIEAKELQLLKAWLEDFNNIPKEF